MEAQWLASSLSHLATGSLRTQDWGDSKLVYAMSQDDTQPSPLCWVRAGTGLARSSQGSAEPGAVPTPRFLLCHLMDNYTLTCTEAKKGFSVKENLL